MTTCEQGAPGMDTMPEPRGGHWMIGIGTALNTGWPAAVFHHRPTRRARPPPPPRRPPPRPRRVARRTAADRSAMSASIATRSAIRSRPGSGTERPVLGSAPTGFSHAAVYTPDLDRFRRFYEQVVGLRLGALLRMDAP